MNKARKAQILSAAIAASAIVITTQPKQTEAQWAVIDATVDSTLTSLIPANAATINAVAKANTALAQFDADANEAKNIVQWGIELTKFKPSLPRITSAGGLQSAISANNSSPLTAGTRLAESLVNNASGSGVLNTSDLNSVESEIAGAVGTLTGQGANVDAIIAQITGQKETTDLDAAVELQNETDVLNAHFEKDEALDIGSSVPCNACSGGFQAPRVRDYSQSAPGQNPGSVF